MPISDTRTHAHGICRCVVIGILSKCAKVYTCTHTKLHMQWQFIIYWTQPIYATVGIRACMQIWPKLYRIYTKLSIQMFFTHMHMALANSDVVSLCPCFLAHTLIHPIRTESLNAIKSKHIQQAHKRFATANKIKHSQRMKHMCPKVLRESCDSIWWRRRWSFTTDLILSTFQTCVCVRFVISVHFHLHRCA